MKIILASKSPRRKELMEQMGITFEIMESNYEENMTQQLDNISLVKDLAYHKALEVYDRTFGDRCVIGSDTIVVVDDQRIGKPKNEKQAEQMLNMLSGRSHYVITGLSVIISRKGKSKTYKAFAKTKVYFDKLSNQEIHEYIQTKEPLDKAGAYGIQGKAGQFIKKIDGCYYSVVGLPINKLYNILKKESII